MCHGFQQAVFDIADESRSDFFCRCHTLAADVFQFGDDGFPYAGAPGVEQRVNAVGEKVRRKDTDAVDRIFFLVQAAVRVDHHFARLFINAVEPLSDVVFDDQFNQVFGGADVGHAHAHLSVIAGHHAVLIGLCRGPGRHLCGCLFVAGCVVSRHQRGVGLPCGRAFAHIGVGERGDLRHAERTHPGVGPVGHPIGISQNRKAADAPCGAPGVLHHEALLVVTHQRERVSAGDFFAGAEFHHRQRGVGDFRYVTALAFACRLEHPAAVHVGGHVNGAHVEYRRLHIDHGFVVDAKVDADRPCGGIAHPVAGGLVGFFDPLGGVIFRPHAAFPQRRFASAVLVPAFHGAAATGALVILARPFVVKLRQVIEHVRADRTKAPGFFRV